MKSTLFPAPRVLAAWFVAASTAMGGIPSALADAVLLDYSAFLLLLPTLPSLPIVMSRQAA